jgi:hypothetical protein
VTARKRSKTRSKAAEARHAASAEEIRQALRRKYDVGCRILKNAAREEASLPEVEARTSREIGWSERVVREARRFAESYTAEAMDELLRLRTPRDTPLAWCVVRHLMRVSTKRRRPLERRAAAEDWSVKTARDEVNNALGTRGRSRTGIGGRPFGTLKSLEDAARDVHEHTEVWLRRLEAWMSDETLLMTCVKNAATAPDAWRQKPFLEAAQARVWELCETGLRFHAELDRVWHDAARMPPPADDSPATNAKRRRPMTDRDEPMNETAKD